MRRIVILLTAVLCAALAFADEKPSPQRDAIKKLDFLVGEWRGEGWSQMGPKRETFQSHERVSYRADGFALLVEGTHGSDLAKPDFQAIGIITFDEASGGYKFHSQTSEGRGGDSAMKLVSERLIEWYPAPVAKYTIDLREDGTWVEIGEYSRDGKEWKKFFEMKLEKVK